MKDTDLSIYRPETTWGGRSLTNYISQHPKARGAKSLTEARRKAFGEKQKNFGCKCKQAACKRSGGKSGSNC